MEYLSNFQKSETFNLSSIHTSILRNGKKQIAYHFIFETDDKEVVKYCDFYNQYFKKYLEESKSYAKRKLLLIYDLRQFNDNDSNYYQQFKQVFPFANLHFNLREIYKEKLVGTIIIIRNEKMQEFFNTIFSTVYIPARPIKLVTEKTLEECLKTIYEID